MSKGWQDKNIIFSDNRLALSRIRYVHLDVILIELEDIF